jgi:hypothetical protein
MKKLLTNFWTFRIIIILLCTCYPLLSLIVGKEFIFLLTGIGFLMILVSIKLISFFKRNEFQKKFDKFVFQFSLIGMLLFFILPFIKVKSETFIYKNSDGYEISTGYIPNDTIPSSFIISIDSNSKIIKNKDNLMLHDKGGSWFLQVGPPADISKFHIEVEKNKYVLGKRSYMSFYYNNEKINSIKTKFIK